MRRFQSFVTLVVVAAGCNEALGLNPGTPLPEETGGSSGSAGAGGTAAGGAGGSSMLGGSGSTIGGDGGGSGEAGTSEGGTGGTGGGRGGRGGGGSGNSGDSGDGGDSGAPGGAGAGGGEACSSSRDCRVLGYDFCIHGECERIKSTECGTIVGDEWVEEDPEAEPHIFGALNRFYFAHFEAYPELYPWYWNLKLAMQEFSGDGRIVIEGEERRPVLLLCHADVPDGTEGIDWLKPLYDGHDHLMDLGVSSVLLLLESRSDVQALVERALNERGDDVFFLDVGGASQALLDLQDIADWEPYTSRRHGRLWHMLGDAQSLAYPFVPLVERIEELVNPDEPTRLAVFTGTTSQYDRDTVWALIGDYSFTPLRINGMALRDQPGQALILDGLGVELGDVVADFAPHIVLDFSGSTHIEIVVSQAFERRELPPPFYIFPPERTSSAVLLDRMYLDPSLRTRVVGLNYASAEDPTLKQGYLERLHVIAPGLDCCTNIYDAVYFLIYGAAAGGRGGTAKALGFERLLLGPERHIGPDGIQAVLARLGSSPDATLKLSGPSGDFSFHAPTGGRIAFGNAWCVDENREFVVDALRYDRASNDFTGTLSCFDP